MSYRINVVLIILSIFFLNRACADVVRCEDLFKASQNETVVGSLTASSKKMARLFMAPVKPLVSASSKVESKEFLETENVLFEAQKELGRRARLTSPEAASLHVDFLAKQLPQVVEMLNLINEESFPKTYYLFNPDGRRLSDLSNVKSTIDFLKNKAQWALQNHRVTSEFFTDFVVDVLGLHYAVWKQIDFNQIEDFDRYRGRLAAVNKRPKGGLSDDRAVDGLPPITPLIQFLNKMIEVKSKIRSQTADGILLWPTFGALVSDDFQDWHSGLKLVGISLERKLVFDGNVSDFFGLVTHDVTNHTVPAAILLHKEDFSRFKNLFFQKTASRPAIQAEILRKIWFLGTHEGAQSIYRPYLLLQKKNTPLDQAVHDLEIDLQGSVVFSETGGNGFSILANQLKSELYFLNETSPELRKLDLAEVDQQVSLAWKKFLEIYSETIKQHFRDELSAKSSNVGN